MADLILGPLVDVTTSKVISVTIEQLNLAVGFKHELKKVRVVLRMLRGVLQDAEHKEVTGHFDLQDWLKELGNIVDKADNVVDEIAYEHLRYKVAQKHIWKKVSYFFTLSNPLAFRLKIANRIKNLNLDLADLNVWATGLGLQYRLANKLPEHIEIQQTDSSLGDPSKIVGRENKAQEVIKSLIDSSNNQPVCVVSIVGMGGTGKTTVAKMVYNNEQQIKRHFYKKTWVCVSENFDVRQILVEVVRTITDKDIDLMDLTGQDRLVTKLREKLEEEAKKEEPMGKAKKEERAGKNYLLILDDVWNEDEKKWESLSRILWGIGKYVRSRVLVTTQSENSASTMGTPREHIHRLDGLIDEDCWSIIKQRVLSFPSKLEEIGQAIASKCRGVASVANAIGGLLCNNKSKDVWLSIKDNSEVWGSIEEANGVRHVLQLSFSRLPTPALKQCFAFCSIFPKDSVMEKEMLIQLWMAEGFLQPFSKRYSEMEDIGDKYFNALSSYCLFQDAERDSYGSIVCKMHDLVHHLAQTVSESQTLILEDGSKRNIPANIRHLNVISHKGVTTKDLEHATEKLRTLFSQVDVSPSMSKNLGKLRVLSFCGANIEKLPPFLRKMKHLRFLDVSKTEIKELPKFITKLYQLQTFRFMDCQQLNRPLEGIWDLINLRHICFNDKKLMPAGIGSLSCLKTLQLFVVGRQKGHQIKELERLNQVRGKLEICNLDMVRNKEEAMGARLSEKDAIQELQLVFGEISNGSEDRCKHDEDILKGLQPHSNLNGLTIKRYCGKCCPSWMLEMSEGKNFLKNLVFMSLYNCPWLESIPSLLLSIEAKVEIKCCKNLKSITYSSLQKLIIEECEKLVEVEVEGVALGSLKEVHIESCGNLKNIPIISKLQSLEILELEYCSELSMIGDDAPFASTCLQELNISSCDRLVSMPSVDRLSSLQKIDIFWCVELKNMVECLSTATCLEVLAIWACNDGLTSLPSLHSLSSLQTLSIGRCGGLRSLPSGLPSCTALEKLAIAYCHNLISIPDDLKRSWSVPNPACLARLKKLNIGGFSTELKEFPDLGFIGSHLAELTLIAWGFPRERLLDQIQHLTALRYLKIEDFDGLEALPNWFGNLSSLQTLGIFNCKSLKHMEAIRCLSKLEWLSINECPELKKRCASGSGSEWDYISHIPEIYIDWERIQREEDSIQIPSRLHRGDDNEQLPARTARLGRYLCCRN